MYRYSMMITVDCEEWEQSQVYSGNIGEVVRFTRTRAHSSGSSSMLYTHTGTCWLRKQFVSNVNLKAATSLRSVSYTKLQCHLLARAVLLRQKPCLNYSASCRSCNLTLQGCFARNATKMEPTAKTARLVSMVLMELPVAARVRVPVDAGVRDEVAAAVPVTLLLDEPVSDAVSDGEEDAVRLLEADPVSEPVPDELGVPVSDDVDDLLAVADELGVPV